MPLTINRRASVVVAMLALSCGRTAAEPDAAVTGWVGRLSSDRPAEWRIAQAYVARAGESSLPHLEWFAASSNRDLDARLKETISLMLRSAIGPEQLRPHRRLWRLTEEELRRASGPLQVLVRQPTYDTGDVGLVPEGTVIEWSAPRRAVDDLLGLHGFAVPAALQLLTDKEPGSRMYGVEILGRLDAFGHLDALRRMLGDSGASEVFRGCYFDTTTVGKEAERWLAAGELRRRHRGDVLPQYAVALEAESYVALLAEFRGEDRSSIVNRLRREGRTLEASSWDDYWARAKPVLAIAWRQPLTAQKTQP